MMHKYLNYIDGEWLAPKTNYWFENINPANSEVIGMFPRSGKEDVELASRAAIKAQVNWKKTPGPVRAEFLMKAASYLSENKERFAKDLCREMGKTMEECMGDIQETIDMTVFCAGEGRRNLGMTTLSEIPGRIIQSYRVPVGVVGAITPWNYPMAMPAWKVMPALITGNAVILKPAEDTPLSAVNLAKAFEYADMPKGILNVVNGYGEEAGQALVHNHNVNLISFTGSTETGTLIAQQCPVNFTRVALEMGGKNVMVILNDCNKKAAIQGIIRAVFATAGQRCASAGRVIIEEGVYDEILDGVLVEMEKLNVGHGIDTSSDIGPIINKIRLQEIHNDVLIAVKQGAKILKGGFILKEGELAHGSFYAPTLLSNVTPIMEIAQKETFGPVATIFKVKDYKEAIAIANDIKYGLTAGIFTENINKALAFVDDIEAGSVFVNTACVGAEIHLPFGGMKGSGNGRREGASHMLDIYSEWKSVSIQQIGTIS